MTNNTTRRHTRLVNKSLQYRFLAMILVYSAILVFFLSLVTFVPDIIQMGDQNKSLELRAAAADRLLSKHIWVWPGAFVIILIFSFHSFRFFFRVVGPLNRFHTVLDGVAKGDVISFVGIRTKDYLDQEAKTLNEMLQVLAEKLGGIQRTGKDALESLKELERHGMKKFNEDDTFQALLDGHRQHLEKLMKTSGYFHLQRAEMETEDELEDNYSDLT
jgi:methyl-accepting chemotaxis protein